MDRGRKGKKEKKKEKGDSREEGEGGICATYLFFPTLTSLYISMTKTLMLPGWNNFWPTRPVQQPVGCINITNDLDTKSI